MRESRLRSAPAVLATICLAALTYGSNAQGPEFGIRVVSNEAANRVDVGIDGQPFTSYIFLTTLKKPVLYPLRTASGGLVTRGYPLAPRSGERVDHPHQVGLWFNYGDVNGYDFWNNSDAVPAKERGRMGTILHRKILRTAGEKDRGELEVLTEWVAGGKTLLREATTFVFRAGPKMRAVDRITRLTALEERVVFRDNKEGVLGVRVARQLEHPSKQAEVFTDASGKPTAVPKLDNTGVSGMYLSSEGRKGEEVWGTRGKWMVLSGAIGQEPVALAIFDHPQNPGYPTYWHARGYGLFAANPLGQKVFSNGREELNFTIEPRQTVTFQHRILILSGEVKPDQIEAQHKQFVEERK